MAAGGAGCGGWGGGPGRVAAIGYDRAVQESPHEREGIDKPIQVSFRFLTGLVGLAALFWIAAVLGDILYNNLTQPSPLMTAMGLIVFVFAPAGWVGLVYACWIRSGRITDTALAFVWALGICGGAISHLVLAPGFPIDPLAIMGLTGIWIMNGLAIVWIVRKVRRIRAASNTDEDAAR